jgi:hypothetical protein
MTFETVVAECPQSRTNRKTAARSEHVLTPSGRSFGKGLALQKISSSWGSRTAHLLVETAREVAKPWLVTKR